jgi:hypothetical protein
MALSDLSLALHFSPDDNRQLRSVCSEAGSLLAMWRCLPSVSRVVSIPRFLRLFFTSSQHLWRLELGSSGGQTLTYRHLDFLEFLIILDRVINSLSNRTFVGVNSTDFAI